MDEKKINESEIPVEDTAPVAEETVEEVAPDATETVEEKIDTTDAENVVVEEIVVKKKNPMMKKWKPVIITAIACAVIAVVTLAAVLLIPQRENVVDFAPVDEHEDIIISNKSAKMVESIEVEPANGEDFEVIYSTDSNGNQVGTVKGAGDEFKYKSSDLYTIAGYVSYILAIEEIKDPAGRDDEFGFNEPKQRIQVNFKGNQKLELVLGGNAPSGDGIYLKRADTGRVYLIGGDTARMLMMSLLDYRDISLFDRYSTIYEINELSIQRPDEEKITIRRKENVATNADGSVQNEAESLYEVVSPDTADADNAIVEDQFLTPFIGIASYSLVEDHPKDLGKYGLDDPTIIEVKDKYNKTHVIKVGDLSDEGGHYVMSDDVPSVVTTEAPISFLNIKHTDFMMKLVWRHSFNDVNKIDFTRPDGSIHTLQINGSSATYDGAPTTNDNAVNLFMHTIQFTIQDSITKDMTYGASEYKIVISKNDGSSSTLELAPINERYYAVCVNGNSARYYVNVSQVNELAVALDTIASGGTVQSVF